MDCVRVLRAGYCCDGAEYSDMSKASRNKGATYEREVANSLNDQLGEGLFKRNLVQTREGGYDLQTDLPLAIECKRVEKPAFNKWIAQAIKQAEESGRVSVLAWRQNLQPTRYALILDEHDFCKVVREVYMGEGK